MVTVLAGK
jgi:hypothetical protein